ncbi:MAG: DUF927 domain-containing protein [Eggerthellaceae bacterium]
MFDCKRREQQGVPDDGAAPKATDVAPRSRAGTWTTGKALGGGRRRELRYTVTATAPWIACDLEDVDTGDVRALVRVSVAGGVRERALDRDVLLNQTRIIGALAPLGANISSTNSKDVVRYLTDCERRLGGERPRARSVTHLGWAEGPLDAFMPYDEGDVRFDPSPDEALKARPFMAAAGTLAEWVAGVAPARAASPLFRCVPELRLAARGASRRADLHRLRLPLAPGKTPTLKAAGSVGRPDQGRPYFRTFAESEEHAGRLPSCTTYP